MKFLSAGLIILIIVWAGVMFVVRNRLDQARGVSSFLPLTQDVSTEFTTNENGLNIIILHLKNPGLVNTDNYKITLSDGVSVLFEQEFSGFNVGDPSDLRFQFPPIISKGKRLSLAVSPITKNSVMPLQIGHDGDNKISLQAFYRNQDWPNLLKTSLNRIFQDKVFLVQWLGLLTILVLLYEKNKSV
jgi:hypothetical protein